MTNGRTTEIPCTNTTVSACRWYDLALVVFDRRGGTHLDTGVIIGSDRAAVERAAAYAIELLKQQKREWSRTVSRSSEDHTALVRAATRATANSKHGL